MNEVSAADSGNFHVRGYQGTQGADHIDHIKAMGELHFSHIAASWGRVGQQDAGPVRSAPAANQSAPNV